MVWSFGCFARTADVRLFRKGERERLTKPNRIPLWRGHAI